MGRDGRDYVVDVVVGADNDHLWRSCGSHDVLEPSDVCVRLHRSSREADQGHGQEGRTVPRGATPCRSPEAVLLDLLGRRREDRRPRSPDLFSPLPGSLPDLGEVQRGGDESEADTERPRHVGEREVRSSGVNPLRHDCVCFARSRGSVNCALLPRQRASGCRRRGPGCCG